MMFYLLYLLTQCHLQTAIFYVLLYLYKSLLYNVFTNHNCHYFYTQYEQIWRYWITLSASTFHNKPFCNLSVHNYCRLNVFIKGTYPSTHFLTEPIRTQYFKHKVPIKGVKCLFNIEKGQFT